MPNTKSAIRRTKRTQSQAIVNKIRKSKYKSAVKQMTIYLESGKNNGFGITCALYLAKGSGSIKLNSVNPHDQPNLNYNFMTEEFDRKRMREGTRMAVKMGDNTYLKDRVLEDLINPERSFELKDLGGNIIGVVISLSIFLTFKFKKNE